VLTFSFAIAPAGSFGLQVSAIYSKPEVTTAIKMAYASLLGLSISSISIPNVTDTATGATTNLVALGLNRRRLGAAAGSLGVTVWIRANLGKAPATADLVDMKHALSNAPAAFFTPILQAVASTSGIASVSMLSASINVNSLAFKNTGPVIAISAAAPAASDSSGGGSGVAVGVGVGVVLLALFLGIWSYRSYAKHGKLPCCRDRAAEKRAMLASTAARSGGSSEESDLTVRTLATTVAQLKAELAAKRATEIAERNSGGPEVRAATLSPMAEARAKAVAENAVAAISRSQFGPSATS
jgi:hypothetical protein